MSKLSPRGHVRTTLSLAISALLLPQLALAQAIPPLRQATTRQDPPTTVGATQEAPTQRAAQLDAVQVLGEYIPEPMLETPEIASFISAEDFQRTGDSNAATALTRVTGLSLVRGKYVYVRGLGERYSSALLNGSPLPSPEPLQRVVPLDLFPSSVLDSVTVQKTYSARYPGEFGGGVIDLKTIAVPQEPFLTISISGGGNSETTNERGLTYMGGGDSDYTGYDDGTRDIPRELREAMDTGERIGPGAFSDAELARIGASLVNAPLNLMQQTDHIDPDFGANVTGGRYFEPEWGSIGVIASAGYDSEWQTRNGTQQDDPIVEDGTIRARTDYDLNATQHNGTVNGLLGIGAEWGGNTVNLTNFYVHDTVKEARSRAGYSESTGAEVRDDYTEWFERELFDTQLTGSHAIGGALTVDWRGSYARSSREAPYEKGIRYRLVDGRYLHDASQEQNYTRFSEVDDEMKSAGIDFSYAIPNPGREDTTIGFGYAWLDNERSAWQREFRFLAVDGALDLLEQMQRIDYLFSDYNLYNGLLEFRETTGSQGAAAYDAELKTDALYAQVDAEWIPLVRTSLGLRYEKGEQSVTPQDLFGDAVLQTADPIREDYFLPTATLTWNFATDQQLRIGASKTIGRPQFRELAPQQYQDIDTDRLFIGNPYLVDTEILNFDARYEWYFGTNQFFTAGLFYKQLDKPIESAVNESGSIVQQTFINAPEADLYGAEFEVRKYVDVPFGGYLDGAQFFVGANYTYTDSQLNVDEDDEIYPLASQGAPRAATEYFSDGEQLQGQSKHLANLQFGIEDGARGTQATFLVTHVGERIAARGRPGQPDIVSDPGTTLDFVLRQNLGWWGQNLTVGFEARNILGEDFEEYQEAGGGRVDLNRYDLGTSFELSLTAKF
ncbi:TonB-dependent receptor domain-containing protein [Coralloluteibacterium stylophorae]|uniref:TonB-dependent receptor n=1 Tax=Coralloluteibacterium stylophorae TaxID=1776034 RepID=A0A8J7VWB7_9GAMM|nr:TonB-dependent receptor [Coralloluteibacterium stylophorae]MBS7458919.1 TonB-dependent receptor [Coralloluteibacterium stylophorae]